MQRFRGGLVFKAHRLVYHSTLGSRVIKRGRRRYPPKTPQWAGSEVPDENAGEKKSPARK